MIILKCDGAALAGRRCWSMVMGAKCRAALLAVAPAVAPSATASASLRKRARSRLARLPLCQEDPKEHDHHENRHQRAKSENQGAERID